MSISSPSGRRASPVALLLLALAALGACTAAESREPSPIPTISLLATPTPSSTPSQRPTGPPSPTPSPEPSLGLELPAVTDGRIVSASVDPRVAESGRFTVTVTSAATDRIDELVLRWPAELNETLRLAPFAPSDERIADGGPPLSQEWTRWVIGPGEQGEPEGTISVGWGPLLPGATLTIELIATRVSEGSVAFDLQLLAGNDLLTFAGGDPAELRVEVP